MTYYDKKSGSFEVGESQTSGIPLNQGVLCGLLIPATTITGSLVSFLGSADGTNYYPVYNSQSGEVTITVGSYARAYSLASADFMPWNWVKGRLGTSGSAKLQTTTSTSVYFIVRDI